MIRIWLGTALLAGSWLMGMGYYLPASPMMWIVVVLVGAALLAERSQESGVRSQETEGGRGKAEGGGREPLLALVLLLPAVWFFPWPYRAGPLLLAVGLGLRLVGQHAKLPADRQVGNLPHGQGWLQWPVNGAAAAGVVLLVQAVVIECYARWTARSHDLSTPLPDLLAFTARLMGVDATADGASVVMHSTRAVHRFGATWDLLFDPTSVCFFFGSLALLGLLAYRRLPAGGRAAAWCRAAGRLALVMAAWLPIRAALMMAVYLHRVLRTDADAPLAGMNHCFSPWVLLLLAVVPAVLAWRFVRLKGDCPSSCVSKNGTVPFLGSEAEKGTVPFSPGRKSGQSPQAKPASVTTAKPWHYPAAVGLVALAAALFAVALQYDPAGQPKQGRVMFVERHAHWSPTNRFFDTTHFGEPEGPYSYNYRLWYDYASQFFRTSRIMKPDDPERPAEKRKYDDPAALRDLAHQEINDDALRECDVLVIHIPSVRYSSDEIDAVQRFVQRGGGLLLVSDHTNYERSGTIMNDITRPMGFITRPDLLYSLGPSADDQLYVAPPVPHPVVQRMGPLDFAVSNSVEPGWSWGRPAILGAGLFGMGPEYHHDNYMPFAQHSADMRYGPFVQVWAARYGKGRVIAFTDSTILSNFALFQPGKAELAVGMLQWLNHTGGDPGPWLLFFACVPLAAGLWLARTRRGAWLMLLAAGTCAWVAASVGVAAVQRSAMPPLTPLDDAPRAVQVVIDRTVSDVALSKGAYGTADKKGLGFQQPGDGGGFGLFEHWIPRLGTPKLRYFTDRRSGAAAFTGDVLVVLYPNKEISPQYRRQLVEFVERGGKLLVVDSQQNVESTANSLLGPFDLSVIHIADEEQWWRGTLTLAGRWPSILMEDVCEVRGGRQVANMGPRRAAAMVDYGDNGGRVMVVGFGALLNDANMGETWMRSPTPEIRQRYDVLFALLRLLVENEPVVPVNVEQLPEPKDGPREGELKEP
jgi:hypothetical protein